MSLTMDDLLASLQNPNAKKDKDGKPTLKNTADTWAKIGGKDSFEELGLERSELDSFLAEWVEENPYNNI